MAGGKARGVFSSRVGAGRNGMLPGDVQKSYWFVQELESGNYEVQALNRSDIPTGPKLIIDQERFLANYQPEPEYYAYKVLPSLRRQNKRIVRGEGHRHKEEVYSAEYEFSVAVEVDEDNVRANFGLGLTYLDRGEIARAEDVFRRLVKLQAIYAPEHKHLFNEFGISMRKNGMYSQALEYYHKAEALCKDDEHLYLNISRAYFEKGDIAGCTAYLDKCFELNREFDEACLFKDFLKINGFIDEQGEPALSSESVRSYQESRTRKLLKKEGVSLQKEKPSVSLKEEIPAVACKLEL